MKGRVKNEDSVKGGKGTGKRRDEVQINEVKGRTLTRTEKQKQEGEEEE